MYSALIKEIDQTEQQPEATRVVTRSTHARQKNDKNNTIISRDALFRRDKYTAYFQPIVNIGARGQHIAGFETLSRDKKRPYDPIGNYLSRLQEDARLFEHDCQMFENACDFLSILQDKGHISCFVSINFSAQTLAQRDLSAFLEHTLTQYSFDPSRLKIELTEEPFPQADRAQILDNIHTIHDQLGMRIALDDFGTESSNEERLYLLREFVSSVKIDKSLLNDDDLIALAKSPVLKNYDIIVEGVQTDHQYAMLRNLFNEPAIQAYALHRPMCKRNALQVADQNHAYNFG